MKNLDFVVIGDITTDAFIKLSGDDADVRCSEDNSKEQICLNFGDKIEYDSVTEIPSVGNSPNASVSAHRLGLNSALVTNLGNDLGGEKMIEALEKEGVNKDFVKVHTGKDSNYHYVLWYEEERTILVKHHEYDYELPDIGKPKWLYLSSLGENSLSFHSEIAKYVKDNPEINLAFQPGTFQMRLGYEKLKDIYAVSAIFFSNLQEAQRILKTKESDIKKLLEILHTFVATGNTVVVIEHNLDVIKTADWIIDMGPDGGINGGKIIAEGTPEKIKEISESYTGNFLKNIINSSLKKTA